MYRGTAQKPFAGQPGQLAVCLEAQPKNKFLDIVKMRVPRACARLYGKRALCPEAQPTRQTCAVSRGTRLAREILFNFFSSPTMKSIALGLFLVADFEFHAPRNIGKKSILPRRAPPGQEHCTRTHRPSTRPAIARYWPALKQTHVRLMRPSGQRVFWSAAGRVHDHGNPPFCHGAR